MFLLDTNVVSELRKPKPHGGVLAWIEQMADAELHLSAVTIGEIQAGIEITKEQDRAKADELTVWLDQVANAYARKFSWRIEVSGESALNLLGLSTQIPAQYIYLSDGPSKSYDIMGVQLNFKKSTLKDIGFKHRESTLIVQALKALGKEHLSAEVLAKIRAQMAEKSFAIILRDTQGTTGWIYEAIKQICKPVVASNS